MADRISIELDLYFTCERNKREIYFNSDSLKRWCKSNHFKYAQLLNIGVFGYEHEKIWGKCQRDFTPTTKEQKEFTNLEVSTRPY